LVAGCGSDDSEAEDTSVQLQIEQARKEGAEGARRQQRLKRLERKVRQLERQDGREPPASPVEADRRAVDSEQSPSSSTALRSFHTPSGNVACEIDADGAACAVDSTGEVFAFDAGAPARIEPGATPPPGSGQLVPYGTVVSAGSITCSVPSAGEPRGVVCQDASSGHGFEASRVPSRQSTY
jgi:hypothetical protein